LAPIDRLVVDKAPMEAEHQAFAMAANGRVDGFPIIGMEFHGVVVDEIDVVDTGLNSQVKYRVHVLAVSTQVLGAEPDHTDF